MGSSMLRQSVGITCAAQYVAEYTHLSSGPLPNSSPKRVYSTNGVLHCMMQALETRIQKTIAKKGDSIKLKPASAQKSSAHKSHQSPTK